MWIYKIIGVLLLGKALIGKADFEAARMDVPQSSRYYNIDKIGKVEIPEISGLSIFERNFITISDSGDESLFLLNNDLQLIDTIQIRGVKKVDWEAMAVDTEGNFYIGDFGNNLNKRKDLVIYKFTSDNKVERLSISYKQQENFPPEKENMNFDGESIFWFNGELHLFSKNRGRKCVKHYILPDKPGDYTLAPVEEFKLNEMITGAAISPDDDLVVLSGYGKLYFFRMGIDGKIFSNPVLLIETLQFGQNEAVAFMDKNTVIVANEAGKFFKVDFSLPPKE